MKAQWIHVRNVFTCESHAYLLRQLGFIIEEARFKESAAGFEKLAQLQDPEFITW